MKDSQTILSDGRTIAYADIGEPSWPCVMFFHGAPSSRLRLAYLEPDFLASGIRLVAPDRPGYGRSSPQPGRSMADWPRDVATLADALDIDRFVPAGHSSGGPYALACAAMLSTRVSGAILLGGVTNMTWPGAVLIPGSALRVLPGHGHFTILGELPALAATLLRSLT